MTVLYGVVCGLAQLYINSELANKGFTVLAGFPMVFFLKYLDVFEQLLEDFVGFSFCIASVEYESLVSV